MVMQDHAGHRLERCSYATELPQGDVDDVISVGAIATAAVSSTGPNCN
ncbi:hypothetical protein [Ensifer adhaerens]|nr:hypothetical protein [Ensifer adhaerens]